MAKEKLSVDKAVIEMGGKLKEHIGSNGNAHLPVTEDAPGFVPVEMYKQHQQLFQHRIRTAAKTDILKLKPGYYEGSQFINHPASNPKPDTPTTWISYIDVIDGEDGRREIKIMDSFSGLSWKRTIHTGGNPESGSGAWIQYYGLVTLWNGYSKLTKAVDLSSDVHNSDGTNKYRNIMVQYMTDTRQTGLALGTVNGVLINKINLNDNSEKMAPDLYEAELIFPTSTTAKLSRNKRINFYTHENDKTAYIQAMAGAINIQRIMGVM